MRWTIAADGEAFVDADAAAAEGRPTGPVPTASVASAETVTLRRTDPVPKIGMTGEPPETADSVGHDPAPVPPCQSALETYRPAGASSQPPHRRESLSEADYIGPIDAAHQQLEALIILTWGRLNTEHLRLRHQEADDR